MIGEFATQIFLAIVQGITDWFPVSSSGHVVLLSNLLGYTTSLAFLVAIHLGSLLGGIVYFAGDIWDIIKDFFTLKFKTENGRTGIYVIVATIPIAIVGFIFNKFFESNVNNLWLLAAGFFVTGIVLLITSSNIRIKQKESISLKNSIVIGVAEVASLFRGVSRTGSTISSAVLQGIDEKKAARFSLLLSIPAIIGADILEFKNLRMVSSFILPMIVSFLVALVSIYFLINVVLVSRKNLKWFGFYVIILAILIILGLIFHII